MRILWEKEKNMLLLIELIQMHDKIIINLLNSRNDWKKKDTVFR